MEINKIFSGTGINLNTVIRVGAVVLAGVVVYKLIRSAKVNAGVLKESTVGATLTDGQISVLAQKIQSSWGLLNDDEEAVYNAFRALGNRQDLIKLMRVYTYKNENLALSLNRRMSNREIAKINSILKAKGIDFQF